MIEIKKLTKADCGSWVIYNDGIGFPEQGKIKSWNNKYIFVVFNAGFDYRNYTGQACNPNNLFFGKLDHLR